MVNGQLFFRAREKNRGQFHVENVHWNIPTMGDCSALRNGTLTCVMIWMDSENIIFMMKPDTAGFPIYQDAEQSDSQQQKVAWSLPGAGMQGEWGQNVKSKAQSDTRFRHVLGSRAQLS